MPWYWPAILSSIFWGLYYPLAGIILRRYSIVFVMISGQIISCLFISLLFYRSLRTDFLLLKQNTKYDYFLFFAVIIIGIIANYISFKAIVAKNATAAAFFEISYPFFAAIFAYLLFREEHLNYWGVLGGLFIASGVLIMIIKT